MFGGRSATVQWGDSFTPPPAARVVVSTLTSNSLHDSNTAVDQMRVVPKVTDGAVAAGAGGLASPLLFLNASFTVITVKTDDTTATTRA